MIEKVKLNEVAKDLNISGKDLTALLQQRFGGEAKKPQTVLSGEELNFVMEHYTQQHAVKDFGEYFKLGEKKPAPAAAPKPAEKPAEKPARPEKQERPQAPKQEKPRAPRPEKPQQPAPAAPKEYAPAPEGSMEEKIEKFLTGLLTHMNSTAVPHAYRTEEGGYRAELVGGDVGMLIGRRGETLDAIQYLTSYAINRDNETRVRVSVDAGDYRLKREEALQHLAAKMAGKAVKYHRNFTLEPMNAYERHVIHAALQDYPEVTTFSTGSEPHRRIVVAYAKEK